jgi:hypothetical protein
MEKAEQKIYKIDFCAYILMKKNILKAETQQKKHKKSFIHFNKTLKSKKNTKNSQKLLYLAGGN